jgi:hypothetical protein
MNGQEFEFTAAQNETLRVLAYRMKGVAIIYMLGGIGACVWGLVLFARHQQDLTSLLITVVLITIGIYTRLAAQEFSKIVETSGADIVHIMEAINSLRGLYNVQFWLLIGCLIIVLVSGI